MKALTYNDVLDSYADYPAPIRPYLVRAETHPCLRSVLTKSFMRVVIDVLARAPLADPGRGLQLRVDVIADKLGFSSKTVQRALGVLKSNGWLIRRPGTDGRSYRGEFCGGEFILGEELRAMLGMPVPRPHALTSPSDDAAESVEIQGQGTALSDGVYIRVNKVFEKEAPLQSDASPKASSKTPIVPRDLVGMATELGIWPEGMCALMRKAKAAKQRLQDLWAAKRDTILNAGATGGRAKAYIEALLDTGEDFEYRARKKALTGYGAPPSAPSPIPTSPAARTIDIRDFWNKKFTGQGVKVAIYGDGSADVLQGQAPARYVRPADMEPVYAAILGGQLTLLDE